MKKSNLYLFAGALLASTALSSVAEAQVAQQFVNAQTGTSYTMVNQDCSKLVTFGNASAVAVTLGQAATAAKFFAGCFIDVENKGAGTVTITPTTSTINGGSTLVLAANQGARIVSDGTNYQVQFGAGASGGAAKCTASGASPQTCNGIRGSVTTNSLSTTGQANTSFTVPNSSITAASVVLCELDGYSGTMGTNGYPTVLACIPSAGSLEIKIGNMSVTQSLSGTLTVGFGVLN